MQVYRLAREQYAHELSGKGAALYGARWNSPGIDMIYTAGNRSLAMAEVAVHVTLATLPADYRMITILIPDGVLIKKVSIDKLPEHWQDFPYTVHTQELGDAFVRSNTHCVLQIPSVVTKGDFNFLINPMNPDFKKIKIQTVEPFPFDARLLK
jgi:RES domain-containing protein